MEKKKHYCIDCKFFDRCTNDDGEVYADDQICEDFEPDADLANSKEIITSKII